MDAHWWIGLVSSFLASGVEVVEAVTIVLAVGVTRSWRSAWYGVVSAAVLLALLVAVLGVTLATLIPLEALRIVIGTLLLIFGLQWLRKAIMRYTGMKELHDEALIYKREVSALSSQPGAGTRPGGALAAAVPSAIDWVSFTVAFKGVLLEGLEVVFIVITFGLTAGNMTPAIIGSIAAAVLVVAVAAVIHQPLSRVPENTLKFVVGIMLTGFGTFWAGEGVGVRWPGADLSILGLLVFYAVAAGAMIMLLRRPSTSGESGEAVSRA